MAEYRQNADWREEDHPRKDNGEFTDGAAKGRQSREEYEQEQSRLRSKYNSDSAEQSKQSQPFIKLQLCHAKNYSEWSTKSMEKSVRSHQKTIALHEDKIRDPKKYVPHWDTLDQRQKDGLIKRWKHEIKTYQQDINRIQEELKKR